MQIRHTLSPLSRKIFLEGRGGKVKEFRCRAWVETAVAIRQDTSHRVLLSKTACAEGHLLLLHVVDVRPQRHDPAEAPFDSHPDSTHRSVECHLGNRQQALVWCHQPWGYLVCWVSVNVVRYARHNH
ncbi:unnamed protein product [Ectocarpus sp. 4 AP-2014]